MASASLGSLVIELAANTAKLAGDLGRATVMAENFSKRAQRSLSFLNTGIGAIALTRVIGAFNRLQNAAADLDRTKDAMKRLNDTINNSDTKRRLDEIAAGYVDIKIAALQAVDAAIKFFERDKQKSAFDQGLRGGAILAQPDFAANAKFAVAQLDLKNITESLRTEEEKRTETLAKQAKRLQEIAATNSKFADQAQKDLARINDQIGTMVAPTIDWSDATVDMTDTQAKFNEELRESLIETGLLKEDFGSLKDVIQEQAEAQQKRVDAFNKNVDAQREKILGVTNAIGEGIEGAIARGETSFKGFLRSIISGLLGTALRNAINGLGKQLADAFAIKNASGGGGLGGFLAGLGSFLGFAQGGSFKVGGGGGTDSQLVAFRASPDETVTVTKPGQGGNGIMLYLTQNFGIQVDAVQRSELAPWGKGIAQQAVNTVSDLIRRGRYA